MTCCSVAKLCPAVRDPMDCSKPGFPCPLLSPEIRSNPCPLSQWCHPTISASVVPVSSCPQSFPASGLFQGVGSLHQVAKTLELQHQSIQWISRVDFLQDWLIWSLCSLRDSQDIAECSPHSYKGKVGSSLSTCLDCGDLFCFWNCMEYPLGNAAFKKRRGMGKLRSLGLRCTHYCV